MKQTMKQTNEQTNIQRLWQEKFLAFFIKYGDNNTIYRGTHICFLRDKRAFVRLKIRQQQTENRTYILHIILE